MKDKNNIKIRWNKKIENGKNKEEKFKKKNRE